MSCFVRNMPRVSVTDHDRLDVFSTAGCKSGSACHEQWISRCCG